MATRNTYTWIHKYIFPGGMLPSTDAISQVTAQAHVAARHATSGRWACTTPTRCGCGASSSCSNWQRVQALGFDDRFCRMWEFYLAYCEAGFRTGYLDVAQIRIER